MAPVSAKFAGSFTIQIIEFFLLQVECAVGLLIHISPKKLLVLCPPQGPENKFSLPAPYLNEKYRDRTFFLEVTLQGCRIKK
jgi:hypothetical protein